MSRDRIRFKNGMVVVQFSANERDFLGDVLDLLETIPATGDDPASRRLHVPVYLDDPEANDEWWRLMGDELSTARISDRALFRRVLDSRGKTELTTDDADAFLRVLNEGRLALGARLGLEVEDDHDALPEEQRQVMDYLGWILEETTTALTAAL